MTYPTYANRCRQISTSTGNGDFTLGAALTTFQQFIPAVPSGSLVDYEITPRAGTEAYISNQWEVGTGVVVQAGDFVTLQRNTVQAGSSGTSKVNFLSGIKEVSLVLSAERINEIFPGNVAGPSDGVSTDGAVALWDGVTGRLLKNGQVPGTIYTQNASNVTITGGSITGIVDLAVADGGTGASTASDARTNLGLGTIATQNASAVAITGGTINGTAIGGSVPASGAFTSLSGSVTATGSTVSRTLADRFADIQFAANFATVKLAALASVNKPFFLSSDLTLDIGTDIADLSTALANIGQWVIASTATLTLRMPAGATASAAIPFSHPYGARVEIVGQAATATTATSIASVSGSAGAYTVRLNVGSTSGAGAGNVCILTGTTGTGAHETARGAWVISAVGAGYVDLTVTVQSAAWPTMTVTGGTVTFLASRMTFAGTDGFQVNGALGRIADLALIGNGSGDVAGVITTRGNTDNTTQAKVFLATTCAVIGFGTAGVIAQYGSAVDATGTCSCSNARFGFFAQHGGNISAVGAVANGNTQAGIYASGASAILAQTAVSCGNGTYGTHALEGGSIQQVNGLAKSNVSDGVRAESGGNFRADNFVSTGNGGAGLYNAGGSITAASASITSNAQGGITAQGGGDTTVTSATITGNTGNGITATNGANVEAASATITGNTVNGVQADYGGVIAVASATLTGNTANFASATGGAVRATSATVTTSFAASNGGRIDITGATGGPAGLSVLIGTQIFNQGTAGAPGLSVNGDPDTGFYQASANTVSVSVGGTEIARWSSDGLGVGTTAASGYRIDMLSASGTDAKLRVRTAGQANGLELQQINATGVSRIGAQNNNTLELFTNGTTRASLDSAGNVRIGTAALATNATTGFLYVPSCPGTPTGTPAVTVTGLVPVVIDSTNNKFYGYIGGAWRDLTGL